MIRHRDHCKFCLSMEKDRSLEIVGSFGIASKSVVDGENEDWSPTRWSRGKSPLNSKKISIILHQWNPNPLFLLPLFFYGEERGCTWERRGLEWREEKDRMEGRQPPYPTWAQQIRSHGMATGGHPRAVGALFRVVKARVASPSVLSNARIKVPVSRCVLVHGWYDTYRACCVQADTCTVHARCTTYRHGTYPVPVCWYLSGMVRTAEPLIKCVNPIQVGLGPVQVGSS